LFAIRQPTEATTFSVYGLQGFDMQYWNGSAWATVPGGSVSNNNKVWKKFTFAAITTAKIRVLTNASPDGYSRLTEVEAWTAASGGSLANIRWLVTDQLGTPRMIFDQTGDLTVLDQNGNYVRGVIRHDYLPFGEELFGGPPELPGAGGRTTTMGYTSSDDVRQKFTSKERDNETGLDYFGARYYGANMGRFASADNFLNDTHPEDPQSWNLYVYVRNNPLRYVDPNGAVKRDKDGNVIFDVVQEDVQRTYVNEQLQGGGRLVITGQVDAGKIYADDGTEIQADRSRGALTATVYNADGEITSQGSVDGITLNGQSLSGFNNTADCHGVTFASGQLWINNDQVPALMRGDGYDVSNPGSSPQPGAVGVYSTNGQLSPQSVVHSITVTKVDATTGNVTEVRSKGGITREVLTVPGPGRNTAWYDENAKLRYYRRDSVLAFQRRQQGLTKEHRVY
jgi:RHS repeat-associated protein